VSEFLALSIFGSAISRTGQTLSIHCAYGELALKTLRLQIYARSARIDGQTLVTRTTKTGEGVTLEFSSTITLAASRTLEIL